MEVIVAMAIIASVAWVIDNRKLLWRANVWWIVLSIPLSWWIWLSFPEFIRLSVWIIGILGFWYPLGAIAWIILKVRDVKEG